jgi:bifunctional non-homologous end joining protein LigD
VYPDDGVTKGQLAAYYDAITNALWPHLEDRPLSVLRSAGPGKRFFQRHLDGADASGFASVEPPRDSTADEAFFAATDPAAIHGLAQMAAVEIHTWGSRLPRVERADRLTFDIDPDVTLDWATVRSAAQLLREFLATLGLASQVKTSGGLGLHVVVPLKGRLPEFETTAKFTRGVAQHLAHAVPELFTARRGASNRRGRMYIDWQRNQRGATTVAAYSPRARSGVPVSMPLAWSELGYEDLRGAHFNLRNAVARVHKQGDPWLREPCKAQSLGARVLRRLERIAG